MKRIPELDGVRGIAIILVLIWHYLCCQILYVSRNILVDLYRMLGLTSYGVDLFFVLSGFLIAGILLDHCDTSNFFLVFYLRRIFRIFPLYFLMVGLFLCLGATNLFISPSFQWLFRNSLPFWSYVIFTQNFFMGARGDFGANWLGITWSLAIEEQFYLFVPFLIYFLPRRALVSVLIFAILAAPLLRFISPGFHALVNTPWRSDSILSGALLAVLIRWVPFVPIARSHRSFLLALFAILLIGAVVMTFSPSYFDALKNFWMAVLFSTFILIAFLGTEPILGRLLGSRILVWFGKLSYGIYMFHQAVIGLLYGLFRQRAPEIRTLSDADITFAALCITLALAALSFHFFETPFLRYGHRFKYLPKRQQEIPRYVPS